MKRWWTWRPALPPAIGQRLQALRARSAVLWTLLPIILIALALSGYGWWWRHLADQVRETMLGFQTAQRAMGRSLEWDSLEVFGFPYDVETHVAKLRLLAPESGIAWDGEALKFSLQPLSPGTMNLTVVGQQHVLYVGDGRWLEMDLRADTATVSIRGQSNAAQAQLHIDRLTGKGKVDATDFNLIVEEARSHIALTPATAQNGLGLAECSLRVRNIALQGVEGLPLGQSIEAFDADIGLNLPADINLASLDAAIAAWRATDTPADIRRVELEWGGISISASGTAKFDQNGLPEGRLKLTLGNHSRILELLKQSGWISQETHDAAKPVLDVLAFVSGDPKRRITVPLRIEGGEIFLGPARVGRVGPEPAP